MFYIKELQVHPMKLFMWMSALDGLILLQYSMSFYICPLELQKLLSWTLFFDDSCESELRALNILLNSTEFIASWAPCATVVLQICVCIDLILTLKRPFTSKESRMPRYIITALVIATGSSSILVFMYDFTKGYKD